jgi:prepilin-type N-terminal cleavage/methylation domain-containing protein
MANCRLHERGFTLPEMLVVIMVSGLMLAVAIPAFMTYGRSLSRRQASEALFQDLRLARQIAVTAHSQVIVAFGDGIQTTGITSYMLHTDLNNDKTVQSDEPRRWKTLPNGTNLSLVSLNPTDTLIYDSSGSLHPTSLGGTLVLAAAGHSDTMGVSPTGVVFRQ